MTKRILMILFVGMLSASLSGCVSGKPPADTYTDKNGKTTVIESDREMCERDCNEEYSRCMESGAADSNDGMLGVPKGMYGASGECRTDLQKCLPPCKAR